MLDGMNDRIVQAMYENLPIEVLIIDANDEIIAWNKHESRLFKRPMTAMGTDFRCYHPTDSCVQAEQVIQEMKQGIRDRASFWFDLKSDVTSKKHKIMVEFVALRDYDGHYLGCMQCTQDIDALQHLQGERRLSDDPKYEFIQPAWTPLIVAKVNG
ncbi:MAG TPA: hypothetical protein DDW50_22455 [Firmicutes bacterium]|jgi:DUF438 domain-containing protein|nr:hypothetical protein [Bacillota bacterium]